MFLKRIFDIVASAFGLLIFIPLFIVLSVLVKLDSPGPVFYKQKRVGKNNMDFCLYKFRTMKLGADKESFVTVGDKDSRITRLGYYLRKYKLDELPQLVNVLVGNMSVVGPRPDVRKYVELYTPEQRRVLTVKPGLTSPASIYYRNESKLLQNKDNPEKYYREVIMQDELRLNLEYVDNRSFWGDIKLIFATLYAVVAK